MSDLPKPVPMRRPAGTDSIACGRGWPHASHIWLSNDTKWCPGKTETEGWEADD